MPTLNEIEQKAVELRQEHTQLASELDKHMALVSERTHNASGLRLIASVVLAHLSTTEKGATNAMHILVGPKVINNTEKLADAYAENIAEAAAHKDEHFDQYVEIAKTDMKKAD